MSFAMNSNFDKVSTISSMNGIKRKKIGKFNVDILAILTSSDNNPIKVQDAMESLNKQYGNKNSSLNKNKTQKCTMQIFLNPNEPYEINFKDRGKNRVLEKFSLTSMQLPIVGQIVTNTYTSLSLIFLSVLTSDEKWEMYVVHPTDIQAQDLAIKLTKLLEFESLKDPNPHIVHTENNGNTFNQINGIINHENDADTAPSIYSLSSTFINTWLGKYEQVMGFSSNTNTMDYHSDLLLLNKNLKEIKKFMNEIYRIMQDAANNKSQTGAIQYDAIMLPSQNRFLEVIKRAKESINIAVEHEAVIYDPSSVDIVNQIFIFLRIIGDATLDRHNGRPTLLENVVEPDINSKSTKFLTDHLNVDNQYYWSILGSNYGYHKAFSKEEYSNGIIDEFHIRREVITPGSNINNDLNTRRNISYEETETVPMYANPSSSSTPMIPHKTNIVNGYYNHQRQPHLSPWQQPLSSSRYYASSEHDIHSPQPRNPTLLNPNQHPLIYRTNNYQVNTTPPPQLGYNNGTLFGQAHTKVASNGFNNMEIGSQFMNTNIMPRPIQIEVESTSWHDRQYRFMDSIVVRRGRLARSLADRSARNYEELALAKDEYVEILSLSETNVNTYWIRNALGDKGTIPINCVMEVTQ